MALAYGQQSAGSGTGTTSTTVAYPATVNAGELAILMICSAYDPNFPSTPSGWLFVGRHSAGAGSAGVDSGTRTINIYTRLCDGTEDGTNVSITATGCNLLCARIITITKASTATFLSESFGTGGDATDGTGYSITTSESVSLWTGDLLVAVSAVRPDTPTWSAQAYGAVSGIVFGTVSERGDIATTAGDDVKLVITTTPITSGSAVSTLTYTMTSSANASGATLILRIRELGNKIIRST